MIRSEKGVAVQWCGWVEGRSRFLVHHRGVWLQHIRSITLQLPFQFTPHSHLNHGRGKVNPATSGHATVRLANCIPFAVPKDWTYTGSVVDVCRALGRCVNVSIVKLVFPGRYEPDSVGEKVTHKADREAEGCK
jgi:hypothetical protein